MGDDASNEWRERTAVGVFGLRMAHSAVGKHPLQV